MKRFFSFLVLAAALALGACDNNTEPMKATSNKNPQVDQAARPGPTTGGDQPATVPQSK
ncbi:MULTISPECIES: hypothetical protein [Mesorhizobium]|uniref:Immunogenic protein (Bcsp31-1) n=1 Tax=Mesorhizobium ciceri biovar biserrulae (strain HAMBI 2942 / LMG 23838 / WSM1271) TaxID=765698 RepID=E8TNK3_MESCW|nr:MULTISPECIES: hypothetical protein [Mesorhizobium]RUX56965.1 hypothetical protein EN994_08385 [Mesorhizobium sp. M7A.F.Ca.CA.002.09.1.1]RUZ71803.1 hypothetical protein EN947_28190 [Mesorhizobium sp. M7A.F.Ca.US.003.02.2.1]RVA57851.1 hypothetical protein EN933_03140 [Mesorhizobium sp. M7A.F.Ca.US.001.01.1.1]ADV12885.1 hypothetical protein Mesci_3766 [Mesorhizobium ciceri biovar biserrulae WSM1271]ARP65442.1 hypothetical protein A9K65_020220 [Mesorhizobium sp. WSM1497]